MSYSLTDEQVQTIQRKVGNFARLVPNYSDAQCLAVLTDKGGYGGLMAVTAEIAYHLLDSQWYTGGVNPDSLMEMITELGHGAYSAPNELGRIYYWPNITVKAE